MKDIPIREDSVFTLLYSNLILQTQRHTHLLGVCGDNIVMESWILL